MGVMDSLGVSGIGNFLSGYGFVAGTILLVFFGVLIFGVGGFFIYLKLLKNKQYYIQVNLFKSVNGKKYWIKSDKAKEMVIPGTNVRLLKWRTMGIFSAYPTRAMGNNVYAYNINRSGELTNFDFSDGEDDTEAKIDYDHRDQTYAYLNLQALINKNFREKNTLGWWKENLPLIAVLVSALLLVLAMWFFFSQSAHQLAAWSEVASKMDQAAGKIADAVSSSKNLNSGIVS